MAATGLAAAMGGFHGQVAAAAAERSPCDGEKTEHFTPKSAASSGAAPFYNAFLGFEAAFSYAKPMCDYAAKRSTGELAKWLLARGVAAGALEARRTFLLIRVARINLIGLAITGAEIGFRLYIMDDDLENWFEACTFRQDSRFKFMAPDPFGDTDEELEALYKAFKEVK